MASLVTESRPVDLAWLYWQPEKAFDPFQEFMLAGEASVTDPEFMDFVVPSVSGETS